jgi:predicted transcriptional regulator
VNTSESKKPQPAGIYLRDVEKLREEKGVKRAKLAYQAGVSSRVIAKIEKEKIPVAEGTATKVFAALAKIHEDKLSRDDVVYVVENS